MGQFFNQPDFATEAKTINPTDTTDATTNLNSSCLYIGTAGDVAVIMQGKFGPNGESPTEKTIFRNVPAGSILPVIVDFLIEEGTTASDFIALK